MTTTPYFDLYKADDSEHVDVDLHINANLDKLDASAKKSVVDASVANLNALISANTQAIKDLNASVFGTQTRTVIPAGKMAKQGTQSLPHNATTKVVFSDASQVIESIPGMCNPGGENIKIIQQGLYLVTLQWTITGIFTGYMRGQIQINGNIRGSHKTVGDGGGAGSPDSPGQCSWFGQLAVDDLITGWIHQFTTGATAQTLGTNGAGTYLSAVYQGKLT